MRIKHSRQNDPTLNLLTAIDYTAARDRYTAALNFALAVANGSEARRAVAMGAVDRTKRDFEIASLAHFGGFTSAQIGHPCDVSDPRD